MKHNFFTSTGEIGTGKPIGFEQAALHAQDLVGSQARQQTFTPSSPPILQVDSRGGSRIQCRLELCLVTFTDGDLLEPLRLQHVMLYFHCNYVKQLRSTGHTWMSTPQMSASAMPTLSAREAAARENSLRQGSTSRDSRVKAFT